MTDTTPNSEAVAPTHNQSDDPLEGVSLDPLPSPEEAELGELCQTPKGSARVIGGPYGLEVRCREGGDE